MLKLVFLTAGLTMSSWAGAQAMSCGGTPGLPAGLAAGVYRGTLAGLPITLQLGKQESRYFYENKGLDIELSAAQNAGKLILAEKSPWDNRTATMQLIACFTLTRSGNTLKGTWTRIGQKVGLPVSLSRADVTKLPLKLSATPGVLKLRRDDPYTFIKLNHAWVGNAASVKEPLSGLSYFREAGASAALNGALQDRQLQQAAGLLDCLANTTKDRFDYELQIKDAYRTPKLLSFVEAVYYDCGGVHPDDFQEGVILDRLTGEEVKVTNIWYGLDSKKQHELYLQKMKQEPDAAECRDILEGRDFPEYTVSLARQGVRLTPTDLPHAAAPCKWPLVIPYAQLKDGADTLSPYYKDIYQ